MTNAGDHKGRPYVVQCKEREDPVQNAFLL